MHVFVRVRACMHWVSRREHPSNQSQRGPEAAINVKDVRPQVLHETRCDVPNETFASCSRFIRDSLIGAMMVQPKGYMWRRACARVFASACMHRLERETCSKYEMSAYSKFPVLRDQRVWPETLVSS